MKKSNFSRRRVLKKLHRELLDNPVSDNFYFNSSLDKKENNLINDLSNKKRAMEIQNKGINEKLLFKKNNLENDKSVKKHWWSKKAEGEKSKDKQEDVSISKKNENVRETLKEKEGDEIIGVEKIDKVEPSKGEKEKIIGRNIKEFNLRTKKNKSKDFAKLPVKNLEHQTLDLKPKVIKNKDEKIVEQYDIEVDGAIVTIAIKKNEMGISYNLYVPKISPATSILLDEIKDELITVTTISMKELSDPESFKSIKRRFMGDSGKLLKERLPNIDERIANYLVGTLMQEMMGLGIIEFLVDDPSLEEIVIPSAKEKIRVYSKKYGWLITNVKIEREDEIINYSNIIARRIGRQITVLDPLLDAHLVTGDRINAVLYPINTKGNTITIRKFARDPMTIIDMILNKTCDAIVASILWLAIEFEMNVLISGGTGSGKTSFLNACMPFISPNQRIISIEDTRELMLPEFLYWSTLVTRTPNSEGKGEVSMLDLLVNSLRMRPDRIILGEMRKQQEAMVLFEAMHTGHSVYATVHADSAAETISRLVNPPLSVPSNLLKSVHLNVVMFRDRKKGIRRILQIAEFEAENAGAKANLLYRWIPENDKIIKHGESSRFFEQISRHTGMSETEINLDLKEKEGILNWLVKNKYRSLKEFGQVMNLYYKNKELLIKAIHSGKTAFIFKIEKDKVEAKRNEITSVRGKEIIVKKVDRNLKNEVSSPSMSKVLQDVKSEKKTVYENKKFRKKKVRKKLKYVKKEVKKNKKLKHNKKVVKKYEKKSKSTRRIMKKSNGVKKHSGK